ncbi:NAD(P)-dependent oxidoreductase [Nocardia brasiliensis]|uniref:Putative Flavin reductase (FR) (NADPH-dependent diaphorase) (NADPH-flavin reductase) (FLR) (Biliverdin reductase B) (BVR-B) (Biliverdin-IX beta-reductase) n=1 Tax=Nocardia brasiliensis (strain ATCC 700358 / HUJEG-1) TaxID=1133849 RepID=K0F8B4_NOCB7|nr:SDR family oxidoreductase [Nocardia brasiliensis]AFU05927.1 putative Flavin reductase (FR) (NADPH-dependent diaphorase) (NADPH-flavin reductase) (FLR) (Biliverdin reductase B) (BVR-B) (Biliverdin-IX beta-reductase) [Nocardia brasiliensis ATCC 700358]OCF90228.1 epimerase [Nocardia brasiliensis]
MKIAVFGATSTVGRLVVEQALAEGHQVTAFTRSAAGLTQRHERLDIVEGDVLDSHSVQRAVAGQDAVLVSLGAGRKGVIRAEGTRAVLEAMNRTGVKRLIVQTTLGVGDSKANLNFLWKYVMFGLLLRQAFADHVQQEAYVRASDLDWTIVRPSAFTDGPRTGAFRRGFPADERGLSLKIARADIAAFMLEQLTDTTYLRQAPGISN